MPDRLTPAELDAINARALIASRHLAGDFTAPSEAPEADLRRLVDADVPRLLCAIEQRQVADDDHYVRGLSAAARFLKGFDQDIPGLDRVTCAQLAAGVSAMADSARKRLGVDGGPAAEALAAFQSQNAFVGYAALCEVAGLAGLRAALCEMIGALDAVAHGTVKSDRPLLPAEQEAFVAGFADPGVVGTGECHVLCDYPVSGRHAHRQGRTLCNLAEVTR